MEKLSQHASMLLCLQKECGRILLNNKRGLGRCPKLKKWSHKVSNLRAHFFIFLQVYMHLLCLPQANFFS